MANLETKNLLVAVKAFARANALPLDKDEVWESLSEAQVYASSPVAYAGQTIKVLMNGKYKPFILQPSAAGGTGLQLEESGGSGGSSIAYVQIVDELPIVGQIQGVIYIQNLDNKGYIWTGEAYKAIFSDVSMEVSQLKTDLGTKADLSGATFTGEVLLHADPTQDMEAATKHYVDSLISNLVSAAPGVVDSANPLPNNYQAGQTWRVVEAGVYAGQKCEVGDLIICTLDYSGEFKDSDFIVVQTNLEGAVTGPESSIDATLVVFDGTTGRQLGGSSVTITSVEEAVAMKHEHGNLEILETFTKTQEEIEETIKTSAENALTEAKEYVENRVGIPEGTTVKQYVDTAIGSGGTDASEAIAIAKAEAIAESKKYTDDVLLIYEF